MSGKYVLVKGRTSGYPSENPPLLRFAVLTVGLVGGGRASLILGFPVNVVNLRQLTSV
jgi:hypothetical protein